MTSVCAVSGILRDVRGNILANTSVGFHREGVVSQYGNVVIPYDLQVVSDGAGLVSFYIYPGSYIGTVSPVSGRVETFTMAVPETASENLADLIGGPGESITTGLSELAEDVTEIAALVSFEVRIAGEWDASSGAFPSGAITGDIYVVSQGGVVDGVTFLPAQRIVALLDDPSTSVLAGNWLHVPEAPGTEPLAAGGATIADLEARNLSRFDTAVTMGAYRVGDGGGATYLKTISAIIGGFQEQAADDWSPNMHDVIKPETFAEVRRNDPTWDSYPAFNNMIEAIKENGGGTGVLGAGASYYLSDTLSIDPTDVSLVGLGNSALDWRLKTFADPDTQTQYLGNPSFESGSAIWVESPQNNVVVDYSGGSASWDVGAGGRFDIREQLSLVTDQKLRVVLVTGPIDTVTIGPNTNRSIQVALRPNNTDNGGTGNTLNVADNNSRLYKSGTTAAPTGEDSTFEFFMTVPFDNPFFTLASSTTAEVKSVHVYDAISNHCIHVETPDTGTLRGHNLHQLSRFYVRGTQDSALRQYVNGIFFDTRTADLSSRSQLFGLDVSTGVGTGLLYANRAYLTVANYCRIVTSEACVKTIAGTSDAGEQLMFNFCGFGASKIGLLNEGAFDLRIFGGSNDFPRQWVVANAGKIDMIGHHLENTAFTSDQKATDDHYRIDLSGGAHVTFDQGYILNGGANANVVANTNAAFRIRDNAVFRVSNARHFGLDGADGAMARQDETATFDFCKNHNTAGSTASKLSDVSSTVAKFTKDAAPFEVIQEGAIASVTTVAGAPSGGHTNVLRIAKSAVLGAGEEATVTIVLDAEPYRQCGIEFYVRVPAQGNGTFDVFYPTAVANVKNGAVHRSQNVHLFQSLNADSDAGVPWTKVASTQCTGNALFDIAPAFTNAYTITFNLTNAPAGAIVEVGGVFFNQK